MAMAATRSQPTLSDAALVTSWVRWAHETASTGRGVLERLTWLVSHAEKAASVVTMVLATAERDQTVEALPQPREFDSPGEAVQVRLVCAPSRPEVSLVPMPPDVKVWRWTTDAKVLHGWTCAWSESAGQRAECVSMDALRLSRDAQRVVWFKM